MPTRVALRHHTAYSYDRPVALGPQTVRLRPAPSPRTPVLSYGLAIRPEAHVRHWHQNQRGNVVARAFVPEPTARFALTVEPTAGLAETDPFDSVLDPEAATWPFRYPALLGRELAPCRTVEAVTPWLASLRRNSPRATCWWR